MARATLTISSSQLFVLVPARLAAVQVRQPRLRVVNVPLDDADARAELLLLSPSFLTPCLTLDGLRVWGPRWPSPSSCTRRCRTRACCDGPGGALAAAARSARDALGFANLRAALPMNLKAHPPGIQGRAGRSRTWTDHRDLA
jgi:glutathione S-transferase